MTRVVHIIDGGFQSGAGRGTLWLQEGLQSQGIASSFLGRLESDRFPHLDVQNVSKMQRAVVRVRASSYRQYLKYRYKTALPLFSPLHDGFDLHRHDAYSRADLIHIHWTTGASFSRRFWEHLEQERRPVVWTLRDMWLFTGGCHYSGGCTRYTVGCGHCPVLDGNSERVTARDAAFKSRHLPPNTAFVAISRWLQRQAHNSAVLHGRDIRIIPNCLPADGRFAPIDRHEARRALDLPADAFVASAGALHFSAPYKGAYVLRDLVQRFSSDEKMLFLLFGGGTHLIAPANHPKCRHMGQLRADDMMNLVYAASDVFLMPSIQEAFGKTTLEAMASGTPVIGFRDTATEEIIEEGRTGWLVPLGDVNAYAESLAKARGLDPISAQLMRGTSTKSAHARFSNSVVAGQYAQLYRELLDNICTASHR